MQISEKDRKSLELPRNLDEWKYNNYDKEMLSSVDVVVRLYVIDAQFHESLDLFSENDSYMKITLGDKVIKDPKIIKDENCPKFYKCFQFTHSFPGPSELKIQFYDHDTLKYDELIGETIIDVERRYFDKKWRKLENHPIEKRPLLIPSRTRPQGSMRCFLDIFPKQSETLIRNP